MLKDVNVALKDVKPYFFAKKLAFFVNFTGKPVQSDKTRTEQNGCYYIFFPIDSPRLFNFDRLTKQVRICPIAVILLSKIFQPLPYPTVSSDFLFYMAD